MRSTPPRRPSQPFSDTRTSYHVGRPWMFDGKMLRGLTGTPMRRIDLAKSVLADAEPEPLTFANLMTKSLTASSCCIAAAASGTRSPASVTGQRGIEWDQFTARSAGPARSEELDLLFGRLGRLIVAQRAQLVEALGRLLRPLAVGAPRLDRALGVGAHRPVEVALQQRARLVREHRERLDRGGER